MYVKQGKILDRELAKIIKEKNQYEHLATVASLYNNGTSTVNKQSRDGLTYFLNTVDSPNTYNILQSLFIEIFNDLDFPFNNIGSIQYAKYNKNGKFTWHKDDIRKPDMQPDDEIRAFTFSLNISNIDSYSGGELLVKHNKEIIQLDKTPGSYIIFPSWLEHQASEVLEGTREAIVLWIMVPFYKQEELKRKYYQEFPHSP